MSGVVVRSVVWGAGLALALALALGSAFTAQAQSRDPTQPPPELGVPASGTGASGAGAGGTTAESLGDLGLAVLVRDGTPYLASSTRLYAVGQRVGAYKIERIGETEIWLRNGKELKKIPRFTGIVRRAATPERPNP